jgi:hypothetical protein
MGKSRIYSILQNGNRVATLELSNRLINYRWGTSRYQVSRRNGVRQLVGTRNSPAPAVAKAVATFVDEINNRFGGSGPSLTKDHEAISAASAVAASG